MKKQRQSRKPSRRGLRSARVKLGISQSDLARKLGYQHTTISRWESGTSTPSSTDLSKWTTELHRHARRLKRTDVAQKLSV